MSSPSLTFVGTPDSLTLGSQSASVQFTLAPASGIEEIANFVYGTDVLTIGLNGAANSVLQAADTMVGGVHAISLYSSADPTHGVVLLGMTGGQTAANLLASHTTFSGGNAVIT